MSVVIKTYVQRFTLESAYDKRIADAAKSISGSRWFANRKIWSFPLSELENLKSALSKAEIIFSVEKGEWNKISSSKIITVVNFPHTTLFVTARGISNFENTEAFEEIKTLQDKNFKHEYKNNSRFIAFPYSHLNKQKVSEICAKHGFGFEYQVWSED